VPATALVVDLRNFTPNLRASPIDEHGVATFCGFLGEMYGEGLRCARVASDGGAFTMTSTGDGYLGVFTDPEHHAVDGFLTALCLAHRLRELCGDYNVTDRPDGAPDTSFGMGLESGSVWPVSGADGGSSLETTIGDCINIAARCQDLTRRLYNAHVLLGPAANAALVEHAWGLDYRAMQDAIPSAEEDEGYLRIVGAMREVNERLCVTFVHVHRLPGVRLPLALFRVSESTAVLGNPRFDALLAQMCRNDLHLLAVRSLLSLRGRG
jgi:class 3 adenylate cyclase